ncbi:MAG: hypothetical protein IT381_14885 [Deltaproteobacteria bacterium]|nr:hypothetical protein [Deltaproteobacteria bacterium]
MTTIKGPGPQTHVPVAGETSATQATKETQATPGTQAPAAHDGFEGGGLTSAPMQNAPVTGSVISGLALIASLRKHPLFGSGARAKPLRPGEQSLGDHELDPALLAVDLATELEQDLADPGNDQNRRAAIAALFAGYPGGRDALAPVFP